MAEQNQNQAQANVDAQRRAEEQRKAQQPPQGASAQPQPRGGQQAGQDAQKVAQQRFQEEKRAVADRPQQTGNEGSQPTPTQQENDEIRAGLRHIDDKEDDRSGPDFQYGVRRLEPDEAKGKYETR